MKMIIANCTKQPHDFIYRMLEKGTVRKQTIKECSQTRLSGDLTTPEIEYIVKQHARYGLISVDEIDRSKGFKGMCYSVDKPIPATIMMKLLHHNNDVLVDLGKENRKEAAVALSNAINERDGGLENLEVSVLEDVKGNSDGGLEENIRVTEHTGRDNELIPRSERKRNERERERKRNERKSRE